MWYQIKQHPWAVAVAAIIHLLLLAFFVLNVDWHREVKDAAAAIEAEMVGDPTRITEIQKQMKNPPPPTPEQLQEEQRLEEERQKQIEEQQRLDEERKKKIEDERLQEEQEQQRQTEQKQREEKQRLAEMKQQEEARIAAEIVKAEKADLAEKERQQKAEEERKRQAEIKRKEEQAEKEKQRQAEVKRKEAEKQKRIAEEKQRKEEERKLRDEEMQAEAELLAGAMEAEEARMASDQRARLIGQWKFKIQQRVATKWREPPDGISGECKVNVRQARTGTVLDVRVVPSPSCGAAMQKSVEKAVWDADPLPRPKDFSIFDGEINFTFTPPEQ